MEDMLKELIRENIPKYDTFDEMCWGLFVARIDEANIYDLFQQFITFDKIMDFLEERKEDYKGKKIIDVCNLYILVLAREIKNKEFPKYL